MDKKVKDLFFWIVIFFNECLHRGSPEAVKIRSFWRVCREPFGETMLIVGKKRGADASV
jgi:hypothetical protein